MKFSDLEDNPISTPSPTSSPLHVPSQYSTPTASPASTQSPPWSPPSPARIQVTKHKHYFTEVKSPDAGINEMNYNRIDYLLEPSSIENLEIIPTDLTRKIILDPTSIPKEWRNLKMLTHHGDLLPAHFPCLSDMKFLPPVAKIFFI